MEEQDFLAVCIPTFNRVEFLRACLDSLVPQLAPHKYAIYVSDNASSDGTVKMLENYKREKYSRLLFRSNETNLGFDKNLDAVVAMSQSRYMWLFCDDDMLAPGAVDAVLSKLREGVGLVIVNGSSNSTDFTEVVEERKLCRTQDRYYEVGENNEFLTDIGAYLICMGGYVVERSRWLEGIHKPSVPGFPHFNYALRYLPTCRAALIANPYIRYRGGNASWNADMFRILMIDWPTTVWSLGAAYSDAAKNSVTIRDRIWSLRFLFGARALGFYDHSLYKVFMASRVSPYWGAKCLANCIGRMPRCLCRMVFGAYLRLFRVPGYRNYLEQMKHK